MPAAGAGRGLHRGCAELPSAGSSKRPVCHSCLEPLTFVEMVQVDTDWATAQAREVSDRYGKGGLEELQEAVADTEPVFMSPTLISSAITPPIRRPPG